MSKKSTSEERSYHLDPDGMPMSSFFLGDDGHSVQHSDIVFPTDKASVARIAQVAWNTFFRHAAGNLKMVFDNPVPGKTPAQLISEKGPTFFTAGVTSRFSYSFLVLYPSLFVGDEIKKKGLPTAVSIGTSTAMETLGGSALEVSAARTFRPEMRNAFAGFQGCIFPFLIRNALGWIAMSDDPKENLLKVFGVGAVSGAASAIPDSIGSKMMYQLATESTSKICSSAELKAAMYKSFESALKNPRQMGLAALTRTIAGGGSAVILSEALKEDIVSAIDKFGKFLKDKTLIETALSSAVAETPSLEKATKVKEAVPAFPPEEKGKSQSSSR